MSDAGKRLIASANEALDLVKRLRDKVDMFSLGEYCLSAYDVDNLEEAADRIEQLERELAEAIENLDSVTLFWKTQLAAEKALADRFGVAMQVSNSELQAALLAWRKARGL